MSPQFFKMISSPHASKLHIPDEFVINYGADLRDVVYLEVPTGATWKVKLHHSNGIKWLKEGWNHFKEHYSIGFGSFLLFKYNGNSHFSVFVFDLSAYEIKYLSRPNEHRVGSNAKRQKSCIPVEEVKLDKPEHVEEVFNYATQKDKRKKKNLYGNEQCIKIPLVDPSVTKMTTTTGHRASLNTSHCRYSLRNKQLKEVKLEKTNEEENFLDVAQKGKRNKANNVKLVEERFKVGDPSASTTHNEKITTTILDASHHRYPLRSKQRKEVKLEQWEGGGNMHKETKKIKLEKQDNLFCAADKAKGKETDNVKLGVSYKDSTASGKKKMLPSQKFTWGIYFNPYFTITMQPAYVSRNFELDIPVNFFKKTLNCEETIIILRGSNGRSWRAKLFGIQSSCPKIESAGWRDFVLGNNLKEHDTCLFELTEDGFEPVVDVTIFGTSIPIF